MFFDKKKSVAKPSASTKQGIQPKKDIASKGDNGSSPLLERYLQKTMTDHMRNVDDEALAKAIQTLLYEEKNRNKHMN
ncbi:MAG: hypothetical protein J6F30_03315 [Cellulosilyticum sp.]|nr:hypothetical protein [Cellulosilyticum sp.]